MSSTTAFQIVNSGAYRVACTSCSTVTDMSAAPWCACLGKDRTPMCVECGSCLCRATAGDRQKFWAGAPPELHARRRSEARPDAGSGRAPSRAPLVMLVDDDEEIRAVGAFIIGKLGFRCTTAANGAEALAMMSDEEPAVIITDALMPKMDGRELCLQVKSAWSAKVVIMTSLYTSVRHRNEAYARYRADAYLAKPIDFLALQTTLARLIPTAVAC